MGGSRDSLSICSLHTQSALCTGSLGLQAVEAVYGKEVLTAGNQSVQEKRRAKRREEDKAKEGKNITTTC